MHRHLELVAMLLISSLISNATLFPRTNFLTEAPERYTYHGVDFPQSWPIPPLDDVYLTLDDSIHYALDTKLGAKEWGATLPSGGAVLHLGDDFRPFTLSIFHQLRCLDILREILVELHLDTSPNATYKHPEVAEHCMNYLRQTVMCRADTRLEHVRADRGQQITVWDVTHSCKDWTAVYREAEVNYQTYLKARNSL